MAIAALFLVPSGASTAGATTVGRVVTTATATAAAMYPSPSSHPIQHVVVIYLENEGTIAVNDYGNYEKYLSKTYGNATLFYAACHGSLANYVVAIAAVTNHCGDDAFQSYTNTTIGDLLASDRSNNFTWAQFAEALPANICASPDQTSGTFAFRHMPFLVFKDVTGNKSYCGSHVLNSAYLNGTVGNVGITSPDFVNFSFYSPNLCDDGLEVCGKTVPAQCASLKGGKTACIETTQADVWLQGFLGSMLNSTNPVEEYNVNHTMFIVTWDEDGNPTTYKGFPVAGLTAGNNFQSCQKSAPGTGYAVCAGHVFALVVDHYNRGVAPLGFKDAAYAIPETVEWLFDLQGKNGTGLDNVGAYDYLYRSLHPGFPSFASISGISGDGYSPGD
ncbi:MAG: hypothetical protein WBE40_00200 [Thermoplasmata archaeon]